MEWEVRRGKSVLSIEDRAGVGEAASDVLLGIRLGNWIWRSRERGGKIYGLPVASLPRVACRLLGNHD